ncbi:hypothetical protein RM545_03400 [Zunongwangia sp. F260]|uniref:Calx-beta domain-containing protein n=1 Tax=Autumnicola lenta TaxID=3075593 RepID=A0ABU3CH99_9FLAO|nr:hypothetical protein [Zunongwangia sp. F260]MDT0645725.1 hypothetical protein [Zunongwangia sp. F260]
MKKFFLIMAAVVSTSFFTGCESDDEFTAPNYVSFETGPLDFSVNENSDASYDITVYTANVTGSDRTIPVEVAGSSTLNAESYSIPASVTIPANTNEGTFTVTLTDNNLANAGGNLILSLDPEDEDLYTGSPLTIGVSKVCAIDINDYIGSFTGTGSGSEDYGYTTEVETFRNEEGDLMINGLVFQWFQDWWGEVIVTNQPVTFDVNMETGVITIPEQPYITSTYEGDPQPAYSIKGTGRINACEQQIMIRPVLVQDGTEIDGTTWGAAFLETIRLEGDDTVDSEGEDDTDDSGDDAGEEDSEGDDSEGDDSEE